MQRRTHSTTLTTQAELTIWRHQDLVVLRAPAHGVQVCCHHVAPEVCPALVPVAAVAQQQELPAGGDDGSHPVRVWVALVGHFQFHPWLETALKADFNLAE